LRLPGRLAKALLLLLVSELASASAVGSALVGGCQGHQEEEKRKAELKLEKRGPVNIIQKIKSRMTELHKCISFQFDSTIFFATGFPCLFTSG
jgi:hypothetical protein